MRTRIIYFLIFWVLVQFSIFGQEPHNYTIDISETFLEERHLRYMYNFALNAALFQYEGGSGDLIGKRNTLFPLYYQDEEILMVIMEAKEIDLINLNLFFFPGVFCNLFLVQGSHKIGVSSDLKTQFQIDFIKSIPAELDVPKDKAINSLLNDLPNSIFAMEFSNLYYFNNRFYLELALYFAYNPRYSNQYTLYYFEYEWCESTETVFAIRTNKTNVPPIYLQTPHDHPQIKGSQMRSSRTIDIPALRCPILR
ncbi:MAG: hypothetical protein EA362_12910 [Saprospirales bacterium]|nr:MAG: hypothetical protein EA362_12910 [Saprospirales bacterium]